MTSGWEGVDCSVMLILDMSITITPDLGSAGAALPADTYIRLNVRLGVGELPGPDWSERARQACLAKGLRFCVNNPIRAMSPDKGEARKMLTMAELRELSDDEVLEILSTRHEMSERQRELIKALMKEVLA